jgi:hypothetical protein
MNISHKKVTDVKDVVNRLRDLNVRIERLLGQVPTSDDKILSELDLLMNTLQRTLMIQTTQERGTLFLEQATGKSMILKERYQTMMAKSQLRKNRS